MVWRHLRQAPKASIRRSAIIAAGICAVLLGACAHDSASQPASSAELGERLTQVPKQPTLAPQPAAPGVDAGAVAASGAVESNSQPTSQPNVEPQIISLPNGILVDRARRRVEVPALVATTEGFLEQIACAEGSREHESLLVVSIKPSEIHAAILLAGGTAGQPGRWRDDGTDVIVEPPTGTAVRVRVRPETPDQTTGESRSPAVTPTSGADRADTTAASVGVELDITEWVRGAHGRRLDLTWVFAGSRFAPNPRSWKRPGEHYVADFTGSIVGLVTFGDETIAATTVIPDLLDVAAATWEAWTERMPPPGTKATLILELE
jgi:hypothetical protein